MTPAECGKLLGLMAFYDARKVSTPDVAAWLQIIGDLTYADAHQAVLGHYGESVERIMPAHIRGRVREIRNERIRMTPLSGRPPADPQEYSAWLRGERKRIADGNDGPHALEAS